MAPNKKRKVIDTAWVEERIVAHIPEEIIASSGPLSAAIQEWRQNEQILPSVSCKVSNLFQEIQVNCTSIVGCK